MLPLLENFLLTTNACHATCRHFMGQTCVMLEQVKLGVWKSLGFASPIRGGQGGHLALASALKGASEE